MALLLVKHSLPQIRRDAPPESWSLSEEGRQRARRLAGHVATQRATRVVSSTEPKAIETAEIIARRVAREREPAPEVEVREGLHEHVLAGEWFDDQADFEEAVGKFFEHPDERVLGKETAREAHARFSRAIHAVTQGAETGSIIVVSHGRVMSLFAAHRFGEDTLSFWRRLGLPALVMLDLPGLAPLSVVERF